MLSRYYSICLGKKNQELPEKKIRLVSLAVLAAFIAAHFTATVVFGVGMFFPALVCSAGEGAVIKLNPVVGLFNSLPIVCSPLSLCTDLVNLRTIKRIFADDHSGAVTNKKEKIAVPIQATILSASTIVPCVAIIIW